MAHNKAPEHQPSRRRWLKGLGLLGGGLALGGSVAEAVRATPVAPADARQQRQPFYGPHQSGIVTPQQAALVLVAFDVLAEDRAGLVRLMQTLTARIAFLSHGGQAPVTVNPRLPPADSGILGEQILPDNLTVTVSLGASLFDDRYGLAASRPPELQTMARFPNDALDPARCHGDLLLQICANGRDTALHALRDIIRQTPDLLSVRWKQEGFISPAAAASAGKQTPVNLLGFRDGSANPDVANQPLMQQILWTAPGAGQPAWMAGGSYQAVRLIAFHVEEWDRTPLKEQETIFGRHKLSGAPLGQQHEHQQPDYASDPEGRVIALDAHIRLANPRTTATASSLMLRRGYSYSGGVSAAGQLEMGLVFISYQHSLEKGFLAVQQRLNGEALEEYIKPVGGGYFFALPGVAGPGHYLGQSLLES